MSNSWILILGANSDIATAISKRFAKEGYNLQLASRNISELKKTAQDIAIRHSVEITTHVFDATDYDSHKSFYQQLKNKPKGVVAAFGAMFGQKDAEKDFKLSKQTIETNYLGSVSILEIIASDFEERGNGFIAGIGSVAGDRGRKSNYIYGSSKSAFSTYLEGLSHRLAKADVHVMIVKPGFVDTKMTSHLDLPKLLTAQPNEVAEAVLKGIMKKKNTIYVKGLWRYIMFIVTNIPSFIFKKTDL